MNIKKSEPFSEFITCYHFCTEQWLKDLETEKVINLHLLQQMDIAE